MVSVPVILVPDKLPPVMLPVADTTPPVLMLPPVMLPVTLEKYVFRFAPEICEVVDDATTGIMAASVMVPSDGSAEIFTGIDCPYSVVISSLLSVSKMSLASVVMSSGTLGGSTVIVMPPPNCIPVPISIPMVFLLRCY